MENTQNVLINPEVVINELKPNKTMKIADLGCGFSGHFVFPLAKVIGEKGVVYAVDVLKNVLENIDNRAKLQGLYNIKTIWSNLEISNATKIDSASLDAVLLANCLYQIKNKLAVLKEADRMLKNKGMIIILDWLKKEIPLGPPVENRVSKEEIISLAEQNNWELKKEFSPGDYHFGIIFEKN